MAKHVELLESLGYFATLGLLNTHNQLEYTFFCTYIVLLHFYVCFPSLDPNSRRYPVILELC